MPAAQREEPAWPGGAPFAFAIFDDTDLTTLENGPPAYAALEAAGMRVTKSVWPVAPTASPTTGGSTCADPEYRNWVLELQSSGHEIGFHGATDHSSRRAQTIEALDRFHDLFGHNPRTGADHSGNREALYWGRARMSGARASTYHAITTLARPAHRVDRSEGDGLPYFSGHLPRSPYFWGDVARERIDYWRNFTFAQLDILAACPALPYHDAARPYVNWWYAATHAPTLEDFVAAVTPAALDELADRKGACIIHTHLGAGYAPSGTVDRRFERALDSINDYGPWVAPVAEVLDHLRARRVRPGVIADDERARLERRWLREQLGTRTWSEGTRSIRRRRQQRRLRQTTAVSQGNQR